MGRAAILKVQEKLAKDRNAAYLLGSVLSIVSVGFLSRAGGYAWLGVRCWMLTVFLVQFISYLVAILFSDSESKGSEELWDSDHGEDKWRLSWKGLNKAIKYFFAPFLCSTLFWVFAVCGVMPEFAAPFRFVGLLGFFVFISVSHHCTFFYK